MKSTNVFSRSYSDFSSYWINDFLEEHRINEGETCKQSIFLLGNTVANESMLSDPPRRVKLLCR